jgi:hypothetical protein
MLIIVDEQTGNISLHQKTLIMKTLHTFGLSEVRLKHAPLPPNVNLSNSQLMPIPNEDIIFMQDKDYKKALGMLNHLANGTHPNIAFSVSILMQYVSDPCPFHWRLVQCIIMYLGTTIDYILTYQKGG